MALRAFAFPSLGRCINRIGTEPGKSRSASGLRSGSGQGMRPPAFSPKNTSMVQPRWISQQARIIFTGSTRPDSASNVTYLAGIGPNDYGKIGPLTGKQTPQRAGVLVVRRRDVAGSEPNGRRRMPHRH